MSDATPADATGTPGEDLGWALGVLLRSYRDRVTPVLADFPHGQRGYQTLCEVVRGEQPSQLALAHHLGIDRTVMTYLVDDLVAAGLVERRPNPVDRRQRQVVATEQGRRAIAALCSQVAEAEQAVLGALSATERARFRTLLDRASGGHDRPAHTADACAAVEDALDP